MYFSRTALHCWSHAHVEPSHILVEGRYWPKGQTPRGAEVKVQEDEVGDGRENEESKARVEERTNNHSSA